jgi:hypothetical protein
MRFCLNARNPPRPVFAQCTLDGSITVNRNHPLPQLPIDKS